jgi:peptidoglycan/LPS O-acetylase OafA/YrhL
VLVAGMLGALRVRHFCACLTAAVFAVIAVLKIKHADVGDLRLASFFLSGACYYTYRHSIRLNGAVAAVLTIICLIGLFSWRASELVLASAGGYVILYAALKRSELLSRFNRLPDVSYGVYLYGWPIQKLFLWYIPTLSPLTLFALSASMAILLGSASWHLIEKPALRLKPATFRAPAEELEEVPS